MKKATLQLETLACPSCMQKIEGGVKALQGVDTDSIQVSFNTSKVKLQFDENKLAIEDVSHAIEKLGYEVKKTQVKDA